MRQPYSHQDQQCKTSHATIETFTGHSCYVAVWYCCWCIADWFAGGQPSREPEHNQHKGHRLACKQAMSIVCAGGRGAGTLKLASRSAPSRTGTETAVTSAWVMAALTFCGAGGLMWRTPDTSNAGALQVDAAQSLPPFCTTKSWAVFHWSPTQEVPPRGGDPSSTNRATKGGLDSRQEGPPHESVLMC